MESSQKRDPVPVGSLRRLVEKEAAEAAAHFLSTGEPRDLHRALRDHGTLVLTVPKVMTEITLWVTVVRGAELLGRLRGSREEIHRLPGVKRAREGLRSIGKALIAARRGRPPIPEPDRDAVADLYGKLASAARAFRRRWRPSQAWGLARTKWLALPLDERSASLREAGLPSKIVDLLEGFDHRALDLFKLEPRESALQLTALHLDIPLGQVKKALVHRPRPESGRKS